MAKVFHTAHIHKKLLSLGWNISHNELMEFLKTENITGPQILAYLDAASASEFEDSTIPACPAGAAAKITTALSKKGLVIT